MAQIKTFVFKMIVIVAILLQQLGALRADEPVFRFTLSVPPRSFDPAHFYGTEPSYFLMNLFRGLYRYDKTKGVTPEGAKNCKWLNPTKLKCELNPSVKWSDGVTVKAEDYVRAFVYLITPETKAREITHLMRLKNARKILKKESQPQSLGVKALSDFLLQFEFDEKDPEFISKLTSAIMIPWRTLPDIQKPKEVLTNGPYKIKEFSNRKVNLIRNDHYPFGNPQRPEVEIFYVEELSTGLNLFDLGKINFLPQLHTSLIPKYKDKKGFFNVVFSRFDYIGFGPELQKNIHLRKALALSANYDELKTILFATGRPGCPSLTLSYLNKPQCYPFDVKSAKEALNKVPKELLKKPFVFKFSSASGQQLMNTIEWYQNQWKKNLGIEVGIETVEQGMFLQDIQHNTPDIFRKGITLDRPTCLSALEVFSKDSPDNSIKFSNEKYERILQQLAETESPSQKKSLCDQGIKILMDEYRIIPQGIMHFTMMKDDKFDGFEINELNQLDLSNLRAVK